MIVSFLTHLSTKEADDLKVYRIAKELGIGLDDAAVTCAGFELAFSDDSLRREIFGIIDRLDDEAAKKGEPLGLILSYAVELEQGGIRVGRYADEIGYPHSRQEEQTALAEHLRMSSPCFS